MVKNPSAMQKTWVRSLGWEDPLEKGRVFWPGKFHGQRSLAVYSSWGHTESDMAEPLSAHTSKGPSVCKVSSFFFFMSLLSLSLWIFMQKRFLCVCVYFGRGHRLTAI